ncbi:hypothetical protein ACU8KH_02884 [Lachancea thermotolerans]
MDTSINFSYRFDKRDLNISRQKQTNVLFLDIYEEIWFPHYRIFIWTWDVNGQR